jgi:NhaP-type Na+/H+ or K+/H+ antiporter
VTTFDIFNGTNITSFVVFKAAILTIFIFFIWLILTIFAFFIATKLTIFVFFRGFAGARGKKKARGGRPWAWEVLCAWSRLRGCAALALAAAARRSRHAALAGSAAALSS